MRNALAWSAGAITAVLWFSYFSGAYYAIVPAIIATVASFTVIVKDGVQ